MALLAPEQAGAASLAEAHDCKPALRGGAGCFERPQRYMQQPAGVSIHAALISGTVRACPAINGCVIFPLHMLHEALGEAVRQRSTCEQLGDQPHPQAVFGTSHPMQQPSAICRHV